MTRLPYLVNVPPFLIRDLNQKNLSLSKKIFLIFYGKFIGFFINRLNGKNFCLFINIFFSKDGKLIFENDRYVKIIENKNVAVYPNKRVLRIVKNFKYQLDLLYDSYLLNSIDIQNDDVIVDCGANVGELFLAVKEKNFDVTYIGFEPDKETYDCLKLNVKNEKILFIILDCRTLMVQIIFILIMKEETLPLSISVLQNQLKWTQKRLIHLI